MALSSGVRTYARVASWGILGAALLSVWPLQMLVIDSGRDLAWGYVIARGIDYPAYGPELNGIWHLGPAWYYLVAAAVALTGSVTATSLLVGALSLTKIGFMYLLGSELSSRRTGVLAAILITLPGWPSLATLVFTHTALVEPLVAASLWLSARAWVRNDSRAAIASSALLALAIHAHPTSAVAGLPLLVAVVSVCRQQRSWTPLLASAVLFVLPFLPPLVAEARTGWPQLSASHAYATDSHYGQRLAALPGIVWGLSAGQAEWVRDYLLRGSLIGAIWHWGNLSGLAVVAVAVVLAARASTMVRAAAGFAALATVSIAMLRDASPAWMFYPLSPIVSLIAAMSIDRLAGTRTRHIADGLLLVSIVINAALLWHRFEFVLTGTAPATELTVGDIHRRVSPPHDRSFWLPVLGHDAIASRFCADTPTALHGDLATAVHIGQGVPVRLGCNLSDPLHLGGSEAAAQVIGIPVSLASDLGITGPNVFGFILLHNATAVNPANPVRPVVHTDYLRSMFVERIGQGQSTRRDLAFDCPSDHVVAVTNLAPLLNVSHHTVLSGEQPLPEAARTMATSYYRCGASPAHRITLQAIDPDWILVAVAAHPPTVR